ncbi:ABC transporter permease subunit [Methanolobus halotolerans]|uniref:Polar amino acid transport system permease protein n=1 Tax=Methanolobus halotolerans TaxID=2052935 RepID=A0A4E0PT73_9EURY|nr:ABC transporter permease subunit [Methanolobus halotolerans]TGC07506.1 hypothetical protein CUN85_10990 [Methanolobus halotolerans]
MIMGTITGLGKLSKKILFQYPGVIYVDFIRSTPLLVQILLFYYGLPGLYSRRKLITEHPTS